MCSIIGFKTGTDNKHELNVEKYLSILEDRGDQSFGYIYVTPNSDVYYNKSLRFSNIENSILEIPDGSWCFMHARKASAGMAGGTLDQQLAKAHPVHSDDETVLLLHNGTKTALLDTVFGSISDSQALATMLSIAHKGRSAYFGGIGVLIYEKNNKIYLYKDGLRPLVMSEDNTIFASEPISDKVKWKNIKPTYTYAGKKSDVVLDFKKEDLGLEFEEAKLIKFDIALHTVKNFSVKGQPKTSYCSLCKKTHIKEANKGMCCVCSIEGKAFAPPKPLPNKTYGNTRKTYANRSNPTTLPFGVVEQSVAMLPSSDQEVLYGMDYTLIKVTNSGEHAAWKGTAIVLVDRIYKTAEGLLFVKPVSNGKFKVKVDKLFIKKQNLKFKKAWDPKNSTLINIVGELNPSGIIDLDKDMDISKAVRNTTVVALSPVMATVKKRLGLGSNEETVGFNILKK